MSVVGIDLGTTNTVVASVRAGKVHVLADERGERLLPSVVSFHPNGEVLVGAAARARRIIDPKNTISSHKRLIGRPWGSPEFAEARQKLTFELREGPGQAPVVHARGKTYTLPELSAFILRRARQISEATVGEPVTKAVITVPAHFNELQRASTKSAGRISGLDVLRILNEPTAAALAYGLGRTGAERVAVYDFGGGTFDCTLLNLNGNVFEVLATAGDTFLGGDDLDLKIADRMAETLLRQQRVDARTDAMMFGRMRAAAEELKIGLSSAESHTVLVSEIAHGVGGSEISFSFTMTRKELNDLAQPLLDRTFKVTEEALALARLAPTAFDKVLLVGGSTRIPAVRARVESYFGRKPLDRVNPEEVVSIGAAIQAAALNEGARRKSIPPPPGTFSPRLSSPDLPTVVGGPPSSSSLPTSATAAGRAALLADVARRGASGDGPRPRAKSITNELPGVFGAIPDLPIVAADLPAARAQAPTTPNTAPLVDLPAVKDDGRDLPTVQPTFDDLPAVKADRKRPGGDEITATFTLQDTSEGPTLTAKASPAAAPSDPRVRTQRMASHPSSADTTARAPEPPVVHAQPGPRPPMPSSPHLPPMRGPARSAPNLPPMRPPQGSSPNFAAPKASEPAKVPSLPPNPVPVSPHTARLPMFPDPVPPAPVTAPFPAPSAPPPARASSRPPLFGPAGTLSFDASPFDLATQAGHALQGPAPVLIDVTPRALVVETAGGFTGTIIPRNAKIPCEQTQKFATGSAMQTTVRIRVAQGENALFAENTYLGEAELSGLRAAPRGEVVIAVTFEVDTNGTVQVRARDVQTGQETRASLKLVGVSEEGDVAAMTQRLSVMPMGAS